MERRQNERQEYRKKMSIIGRGEEGHQDTGALTTDLKKLNQNKFFFDLEGDSEPEN